MTILATDLDRTFIFSSRTVKRALEEVICIEQVEGRPISYVSQHIVDTLQQAADLLVIPVTTRAWHQYARIELFQSMYQPQYAVVANGGIVLKDGERDPVWDAHIQKQQATCMAFKELPEAFQVEWQHEMFESEGQADGLFYVLMLDLERIDMEALQQFADRLAAVGWKGYKNGRKWYMLPRFLTKEAALAYVLERLGASDYVAAGDSIMDYGFLKAAPRAFTPGHGELRKDVKDLGHIELLEARGVAFTEMMLQKLLNER